MVHRGFEVPRTDALGYILGFQVGHQGHEAGLRFLVHHGCALDGADLFEGFFAFGGGQGVAVVEDVGGFGDVEGGAHLAEHVVLLDAGRG